MNKSFKLNNGKKIEENGKPYFIAELNSSHFGNLDYAEEMIRAVKNAGADCVKFQSWSSSSLYSSSYYKDNPIAASGCANSDAAVGQSLPTNGTASNIRLALWPRALSAASVRVPQKHNYWNAFVQQNTWKAHWSSLVV